MKPLPFPRPNGHDKSAKPTKPHGRPPGKKNRTLDELATWEAPTKHGGDRTFGRRGHVTAKGRITHNLLKQVARKASEGKQTLPLEFMLTTLNSEDMPWKCRAWAAKEAAPYLHRRMPIAIEGGDANKPLVFATAEQLQGLPTAQLEVMMGVLSRFSREELSKHTGVNLLPAVIDNETGEVE